MEQELISPTTLLFSCIFSLVVVTCVFVYFILISPTQAVFCSVGQGDASYIHIRPSFDIVIDAGPDSSVLECLGQYMPPYDRTIEIAILSHPDLDHFGGFTEMLKRYKIQTFIMPPVYNSSDEFEMFTQTLQHENARIVFPVYGDILPIPNGNISMIWPTQEYIARTVSTESIQGNKKEDLGTPLEELNSYSLVFVLQLEETSILYTGDILPETITLLPFTAIPDVDILKVPHHGSKNGLTSTLLYAAQPEVSIISAGKNNRFKHPSQEIIELLNAYNKPYVRTDINGDIRVTFTQSQPTGAAYSLNYKTQQKNTPGQ